MMTQDVTTRLQELVREILPDPSLYVVEVDVRGARGSQVVDVYVDGDEGIGVDQLTKISRELGFLLDSEDIFDSKYNLNVSSPGIDRPLKAPRQFKKNIGRELVVEYREEESAPSAFATGTLQTADDEGLTLQLSSDEHPEGGDTKIPYVQVREARVRLPW